MTQLSKERIEQYISDPLEYGLTRSEQMEMARRLLAVEGQEPVATAYRLVNKFTGTVQQWKFTAGTVLASEGDTFLVEVLPLYLHPQPAPVAQPVQAPDDEQLRALFDAWFASDCSFDRSPDATEEDNIAWRESYWYVWQRCRAAMIADTKVSSATDLS